MRTFNLSVLLFTSNVAYQSSLVHHFVHKVHVSFVENVLQRGYKDIERFLVMGGGVQGLRASLNQSKLKSLLRYVGHCVLRLVDPSNVRY